MTQHEHPSNVTADHAYALLTSDLNTLLGQAKEVHSRSADRDIQKCVLLSIKTGACPEDCGYCSQSARYDTGLQRENLLELDQVKDQARKAREAGASRFCMGAAWRDVPQGKQFEKVLDMISAVADEGLEVCCTLGMASESQLHQMKEAGLTAYNHNLDTSREYYPKIISTRTYDDRLNTLRAARKAGVQLCCGAILGMGESIRDRASVLAELANMNPPPESVPINLLVPIEGTPLENAKEVPFEEFLRTIAVARILMPTTRVRLSAGRNHLSQDEQRLCMEAGANSIFFGEKLLTTENVDPALDNNMLAGMTTQESLNV
jgi:biotin synthase